MKIIKIPLINGLGKTNGCEKAPEEIINSLDEIFSNEFGVPIDSRIFDIESMKFYGDMIENNREIKKISSTAFNSGDKVFFLGGDHSLSFSCVSSFMKYCNENEKEMCLIVFDAHPDCMPTLDDEMPTHEEWLRVLVEKGFPAENILLVGVRNSDAKEITFLKQKGIRVVSMNQLMMDIHDSCDVIMEFSSGKDLYLSLDIDVLDPAFAPGTGYREVGGLTSRQLIYILQRMKNLRNLKAIDLVEINPDKDINGMTVRIGAKILGEMI